jgi:hypothetical protein
MRYIYKRSFLRVLLLALLAISSPLRAGSRDGASHSIPAKTEPQLIQDLAPANPTDVIVDALGLLEDMHKKNANCTNSIPAMKMLLPDTREPVRRKAARVLGVFHAPMDDADIKLVCAQLKASDWREVQSGLKALRDLQTTSTIPDILPCLKHFNPFVVRDACRTLAVLGTKDVIPSIEPLLNNPDEAVRKDAQDAINKLRAKP